MNASVGERAIPLAYPRRPALVGRPLFAPVEFSQADVLLYTRMGYGLERYLELIAAILCGGFLLLAFLLEKLQPPGGAAGPALSQALYFLAYLTGSYFGLLEAWRALRELSVDIHVLMMAGAFLAAWIGAPAEGGFLLFLFTLSGALERLAQERTRSALRSLTKIMPTEALVLRPGGPVKVRLREVAIGDRVLVRPGDQVPVDGLIVEGSSSLDESSITGEFAAREKGAGDAVFAGTINHDGTLTIESTKHFHDTALARIRKLVLEAQDEKVKAQRLFDRFGRYYTSSVMAGSALFGIVLWLAGGATVTVALYRAITLLIVCSPCALILSVPTVALSGLARVARAGLLVKGGAKLEELARVRALVLDKTGTITTGAVRLCEVRDLSGFGKGDTLAAAAALERWASHPLGQPVLKRAEELRLAVPAAGEVVNVPGVGLRGTIDGEPAFVGRPEAGLGDLTGTARGLVESGVAELRAAGSTVALVRHGERLGLLGFQDTVRADVADILRSLRGLGIEQVVMLTGDSEEVARAVGAQVGIDRCLAGLMPEGKVAAVRQLAAGGLAVAMVGDGVNDAPALKAATVGIAMGAIGSNVAMEAADVVLANDDISKLVLLFAVARAARRTMAVNIVIAAGVIAVLAVATMVSSVPLALGVVGHEGSTLLVVANSLRLLFIRDGRFGKISQPAGQAGGEIRRSAPRPLHPPVPSVGKVGKACGGDGTNV